MSKLAIDQWLTILVTDCAKSKQCAPYKHHYDECVERVTEQQGKDGKADEDCVEECTSIIDKIVFLRP